MKRKLHIKRFALLAAVMLVLAISFTGCGKDSSNSESKGSNGPKASLKNFETTTLDGEKFTQDNLKDYDLTVVNVWSTTCGYCIDEMPALEKLKNQLPSNVQFVSICLDGEASPDTAKEILSKQGLTAKTLVPSDSLNEGLLQYVSGTPTTVFFDKNGKQIGDPKVGAFSTHDTDAITELYMNEVNSRLKKLS